MEQEEEEEEEEQRGALVNPGPVASLRTRHSGEEREAMVWDDAR